MTRDFCVRKKKGRFLSSNQDLYQWETPSKEQVEQTIEIALILNPYIDALTGEHLGSDFFKKIVGEIEEKFLAQNKKSKSLKISLEQLSEISVVGSIGRVSFLFKSFMRLLIRVTVFPLISVRFFYRPTTNLPQHITVKRMIIYLETQKNIRNSFLALVINLEKHYSIDLDLKSMRIVQRQKFLLPLTMQALNPRM